MSPIEWCAADRPHADATQEALSMSGEVVIALENMVAERHLLKHPFYQD